MQFYKIYVFIRDFQSMNDFFQTYQLLLLYLR